MYKILRFGVEIARKPTLDEAIDYMLAQPGVQYVGIGYTAYTQSDVDSHGVPTYSIIWW